jgi:membrane-associated protease RseP (regulator of RpoE activity)
VVAVTLKQSPVLSSKGRSMVISVLRFPLFILSLLVVMPAFSAESTANQFNPFAESYVKHLPAPAAAHEPLKLYAGTDKVEDYYRLLEEGYDMLGYSSFEAGNVPPERVAHYAGQLNADVVLVYTKGVDVLKTPSASEATAGKDASQEDRTLYEYFASYWTKMPPPLLGLHVQRENGEEDESGLEVLAVIKQSPAAVAGIQRGDVLTQLGDQVLHRPEQLVQAAQRYAGQTVRLSGTRDGEVFARDVTLARRAD